MIERDSGERQIEKRERKRIVKEKYRYIQRQRDKTSMKKQETEIK